MNANETATDWDSYYKNRSKVSTFTQRINIKCIFNHLDKYISTKKLSIVEFGGGDSCFYNNIIDHLDVEKYIIVDTSKTGIRRFLTKYKDSGVEIAARRENILDDNKITERFDLCFSVGLIEHFDAEGTRRAIKSHFDYVKDGGLVLICFPVPTTKYKVIRKAMEICKVWKFFDERPLTPNEIKPVLQDYGEVLCMEYNKKLPLTQMVCIVRAKPAFELK